MGSTFTSLHFHIVFSTKHRQPLIKASWRERLHEYLGGTVNGLKGYSQGVGGSDDHVHLLAGLKSTRCLADFMRELKKSASLWVRNEIWFGRVCLAGRLRSVHRESQRARTCKGVHRESRKTSSKVVFRRRTRQSA